MLISLLLDSHTRPLMMPRPLQIFSAVLVAVSVFLVLHALSARISWPLAIHPDDEKLVLDDDKPSQVGWGSEDISFDHHDVHSNPVAHPHHHTAVPSQSLPNFSRKIVAVGDLHGDLPNALTVLQMADVVDEEGNWTGDVDFFVQTGDIIDRGDDTLKLYALVDKLRDQAKEVGGTVLSHLGNHEWMNVIGAHLRPSLATNKFMCFDFVQATGDTYMRLRSRPSVLSLTARRCSVPVLLGRAGLRTTPPPLVFPYTPLLDHRIPTMTQAIPPRSPMLPFRSSMAVWLLPIQT